MSSKVKELSIVKLPVLITVKLYIITSPTTGLRLFTLLSYLIVVTVLLTVYPPLTVKLLIKDPALVTFTFNIITIGVSTAIFVTSNTSLLSNSINPLTLPPLIL